MTPGALIYWSIAVMVASVAVAAAAFALVCIGVLIGMVRDVLNF